MGVKACSLNAQHLPIGSGNRRLFSNLSPMPSVVTLWQALPSTPTIRRSRYWRREPARQTGRLWVYLRDERDWAGVPHPVACYKFTPNRRGQWPRDHLQDFSGWLHADGYAGYEELYRRGDIHEVACLAHIRRKFFDIHVAQGSGIAKEALERIAELYRIGASI